MFYVYSLTQACLVAIHFLGGPISFCVEMKGVCRLIKNNGSRMCVGCMWVGLCVLLPQSFYSEILKRIYDRKTSHVQTVIVLIFDSYF
jgi:hypothetical protein